MNLNKIGVILAQVGTPEAPTKSALRTYLKKFLSDKRVVDYPRWWWLPLLHGVILNTRPAKSAEAYREIWTDNGSPLLIHSQGQVAGVQERLGVQYRVALGLAYSTPSIADAVAKLESEGIEKIVVLPLFPQFSTATTASLYDEVARAALGESDMLKKKYIPALRFVEPYFNHTDYIKSLARLIKQKIDVEQLQPDKFIISFHGLPKRFIDAGDPYEQQCKVTAELLAQAMGWQEQEWMLCFQSRFGREEWLQPYLHEVLTKLSAQGVKRPIVITPGFASDCLETLHELGIEGRELYAHGGGDAKSYALVPCLNTESDWLDFLAKMIKTNAQGWEV